MLEFRVLQAIAFSSRHHAIQRVHPARFGARVRQELALTMSNQACLVDLKNYKKFPFLYRGAKGARIAQGVPVTVGDHDTVCVYPGAADWIFGRIAKSTHPHQKKTRM